MTRITRCSAIGTLLVVVFAADAALADSASCQKAILKDLLKVQKTILKAEIKCLNAENALKLPGPCPDAATQLKIQAATTAATSGIASACTSSDVAALGYRTDCVYESNTAGKEAACAALPVGTDPTLLAQCLECWSSAEASEYIAVLFASHANEVCGGDLSESSSVCSDLDCTSPLPDHRKGRVQIHLEAPEGAREVRASRRHASELSGRSERAGEPGETRASEDRSDQV